MLKYTIQVLDTEKKEIVFQEVNGYKLPNGLAAHKDVDNKCWVLDDLNSGCKIKDGFPTYSNLRAHLDSSNILKEVFERRKSERYALLVKRNRDKKTITLNKETEERKENLWDD